ncbi:hypothetical protein CANARDRAFT_185420, partial [[Candida] arabinofermentans NRRL YB-2248]
MHILKFPWLKHTEENRNFEVYSVSVSPDGQRLASGGLDGKIRIWLVDTLKEYHLKLMKEPFVEEASKIELDSRKCRPLCSMGRHTGAVTCVRFSPTGRFLASGSDDKILLIWEKDEEKTRIMAQNMDQRLQFGFDGSGTDIETADLEHWTVRKRLVAHDNDIQDMAWAPDSSILVTVGLDRSIIVWSGTTFEKIKRFDIHQSHVKGVVFDPANKYFATCSDDRTLRIFRYRRTSPTEMSFSVESVVMDPFKKTPLTTYFRRCSWSPDGQHIAAPNATNGGLSSVAIINRGSWESEISLIGHDLPCEVCSFSPRLYEAAEIEGQTVKNNKSNEPRISTVLATAGQDRTLALWNTSMATPLAVATDICLKTITDISWDPMGEFVFISSLDGTITTIFFENSELGKPIPLEINDTQLHRYGADRESMVFPESIDQLKLEEKAESLLEKIPHVATKLDKLMGGGSSEFNKPQDKTAVAASTTPVINTLMPRSKKHPNKLMPSAPLQNPFSNPLPSTVNILVPSSQKITYTKSGKKRVAPLLISGSSSSSTTANINGNTITSTSVSGNSKPTPSLLSEQKKRANLIQKNLSTPSYKLPRLGLQTLVSSIRDGMTSEQLSDGDDAENNIDHIAENSMLTTKKRGAARNSTSRKRREIDTPSYLSKSMISPASVYGDLKIQPFILLNFEAGNPFTGDVLEIRNDSDDEGVYDNDFDEFDNINKLFVSDPLLKKFKFEYYNNHKFTNACNGNYIDLQGTKIEYWCVTTETGSIVLLSKEGRQLRPSFEVGCNITHLFTRDEFLLALTSTGLIYSWDLKLSKCLMSGISISPIINEFYKFDSTKKKFEPCALVKFIEVGLYGLPIIVLTNDYVYEYKRDWYCWVSLFDPWYIEQLNIDDLKKIRFDNKLYRILIRRLILKTSRDSKKEKTLLDDDIVDVIKTTFNQL